MVVEHQDRTTRLGFRFLETLLEQQGRRVAVVNLADNEHEDVVADLVAIVSSYCERLMGRDTPSARRRPSCAN
jgi:predicted site-specific integrase-resolvase